MLNIDPRTIVLLASFLSLPLAIALLLLKRIYPPSIHGIREWAISPLLFFLATLMFGSFGTLPDMVSLLGGNTMVLSGALLLYFGSQRFFGVRPAHWPWMVALAVVIGLTAWSVLEPARYAERLIAVNAFLAGVLLKHAVFLFGRRHDNIFVRLTALALFMLAIITVVRAGTVAYGMEINGVFDPATAQVVYLASLALGILLITMGTVLMASERMRREFEYLANHDTLTGTLTRRAFIAACEQEMDRFRRNDRALTMMMLDLDHFKKVNDTHGHLVGDKVLVDFAQRVSAQLRSFDKLGRYGGEEFVVMLPETPLDGAAVVAQRIMNMAPNRKGLPHCTVSIGLASIRADDPSIDTLLARADATLYQAKANGRNRLEKAKH
jgi:diguanylate cyclase (GGDEF)-like protein